MLALLDKHGVALVSLYETLDTKTPMGRLLIKIMGSLAEMEREQASERTRDALRVKRGRGEKTGGRVPYGFDVVVEDGRKKLVPNEKEQAVIAEMRWLRGSGLSFADIACELNERGKTTKEGSDWRRQYIHRILSEAK